MAYGKKTARKKANTRSVSAQLKKKKKTPLKKTNGKKKTGGLKSNRGVTKQELASGSRKIARAMHPKAKKKKNETAAQKADRKSYNKTRRKTVRAAGKGHKSDKKGIARKFLH